MFCTQILLRVQNIVCDGARQVNLFFVCELGRELLSITIGVCCFFFSLKRIYFSMGRY